MKKTTYLFIAGIILLFAYAIGISYRILQKELQRAEQTESTLTRTPFRLKGTIQESQYYSLFTKQYKTYYERVKDSATIMEFPHSIIHFSVDGGANLYLLNDGTAMTYDCDHKQLVAGSMHNLQLAVLQDSLNQMMSLEETEANYSQSGTDDELVVEMNDSSYAHTLNTIHTQQKKALELMVQFNSKNRSNWAPAALLYNTWPYFNYEEMVQFVDTTANYWQHPELEDFHKTLQQLAQLKEGTPMTDVPCFTPDGKLHKLKEWTGKGHYTIVAINHGRFSPLTQGLLEYAYQHYHQSKGLEIVQIGNYNDYRYWKNDLDKQSQPWVNTSTLGGSYPLTQAYTSLPFYILFSPKAEIVTAHPTVAPLLLRLEKQYQGRR